MKLAIIFVSVILSAFSNAGYQQNVSHGVTIGGWSYHYLSDSYKDEDGIKHKYNQSHDMLGWFGDYGDNWAQVGTFTNSYNKRSFFGAKGFKFTRHQYYYTGMTFGFMTGYENTEASNSAFIALNGGLNIGRNVTVDGMLGWGQANVSFRFNFK